SNSRATAEQQQSNSRATAEQQQSNSRATAEQQQSQSCEAAFPCGSWLACDRDISANTSID
ncbi:hypothetical protein, partial [uncultured Pseudomonas sp.]|uniref:hypothetical protein n=1 Tax=uncultured Pseudomonas sp. TaxID=114707 RepID=UPI002593CA56